MVINIVSNEYLEGNEAVHCTTVYFLGIPIYSKKQRTTNAQIKSSLSSPKRKPSLDKQIKGFKDETKNRSKKG